MFLGTKILLIKFQVFWMKVAHYYMDIFLETVKFEFYEMSKKVIPLAWSQFHKP